MRIAVTGAGGFLGSEILRQLSCAGEYELLAITSKRKHELIGGSELLNLTTVDSCEAINNPKTLSGVDVLINCAFPRNADDRRMAQGIQFVDGVFYAASAAGVESIVNISSQSVYDQGDSIPATEHSDVCVSDVYAALKLASELLLSARCPNANKTNLRLASLIGPGFNQRVVNKMVAGALRGEARTVFENGSRFGYLDVKDAASGIIALLTSIESASWNELYNLGPDKAYTLTEIACTVKIACEELLEREIEIVFSDPMKNSKPVFSTIDSALFRRDFGWMPSMELLDSVKVILQHGLRACGNGDSLGYVQR